MRSGVGAHAERASASVNAILAALPLLGAAKELEAEINEAPGRPPQFENTEHPLNYNVGVIRGGDWASSVPEECVFEVRISCYPGANLEDVEGRFKNRFQEAAKRDPWLSENPPQISFCAFRAEGCAIDRDEPVAASLVECHRRVTGEEFGLFSFTRTTDARFFNLYYGIPATCYGPLGANLHAPDEWVDLESVREVTKVLALSAIDWCGTAQGARSGFGVEGGAGFYMMVGVLEETDNSVGTRA